MQTSRIHIVGAGLAGLAAALFMCWAMHASVGGQTGDTLGAQQQMTELMIYLAVATLEIA